MSTRVAGVALVPHVDLGPDAVEVREAEIRGARVDWRPIRWGDLGATPLEPGTYDVRVEVDGGAGGRSVVVPVCAGRARVTLDGRAVNAPPGPVVAPLAAGLRELVVTVRVSPYERRVACGGPVRAGTGTQSSRGLDVMTFPSPFGARGGGQAVVYVPPAHDATVPAAVVVGLHPWNGTMWTYAAYDELLREARARDVVVLLPSGLGNSLYTSDAEDEAMRALDALPAVVAVDPRRVSLWGASMGGAGATTVGLHHPDRFAAVTSFFGDSAYDLTTYARGVLHDEAGAHQVDALDVVDNARSLPVWLVHGEIDRTSPIRQSELLDEALRARGFTVRFDRAPGVGHSGALVARWLPEVVAQASTARAPACPERVTYRSVRPWDTGAYGVSLERLSPEGDAYVDVERSASGVHVRRADGVRAIVLDPACAGAGPAARTLVDDAGSRVEVRWATRTP